MIICKRIVADTSSGGGNNNNNNNNTNTDSVRGSGDNSSGDTTTRNNFSGRNDQQDDSDTISFRSKHPKSDIVKKRRKSDSNDDNGSNNNANNETQRTKAKRATQQIYDEESLFPISIPEEERGLNIASIGNDDDNDERDGASYAKSVGTSYSVQMCGICLEEYKVGEEIAWSRNDKCHHAFHKD